MVQDKYWQKINERVSKNYIPLFQKLCVSQGCAERTENPSKFTQHLHQTTTTTQTPQSTSSCNDFSTEIFHFFFLQKEYFSLFVVLDSTKSDFQLTARWKWKTVYIETLLVKLCNVGEIWTNEESWLLALFSQPTESILNVTVAVKWSSNNHKFLELFSIVIIFSIKSTTDKLSLEVVSTWMAQMYFGLTTDFPY